MMPHAMSTDEPLSGAGIHTDESKWMQDSFLGACE